MDKYIAIVFTVVAIALVFISVQLWELNETKAPTAGEYRQLGKIKNPDVRRGTALNLRNRMPLIIVQDIRGTVSVDGEVSIEGSVPVYVVR